MASSSIFYDTAGVVSQRHCINTIAFYIANSSSDFLADNETGDTRLNSTRNSSNILHPMGKRLFCSPDLEGRDHSFNATTTKRNDEFTNGPPRPLYSFLPPPLPAMVRARDLSLLFSSQPSSSQNPCDEEAVERAFWQSTPTALEELKKGTDDESHQAGAILSRFS
jgi:hypothetical protein